MINVCLENDNKCRSFETVDKAINFLEGLKEVEVGDIVKVIDTGRCYSNLRDGDLMDLYKKIPLGVGGAINVIFNINKKCLGYSHGVYSIDDTTFEVIAKFSNNSKLIIKAVNKPFKYGGYYIIEMDGVKKCGI